MNGAGWVIPANYEVMKMKAINHKPMIRPKGTLAFQDGEEVRSSIDSLLISHLLDLSSALPKLSGLNKPSLKGRQVLNLYFI
jgi:transposase